MPRIVQVVFEGRLGNNMFQYAFGRALADLWGAELQTPDWIGQAIFTDAGSKPLSADTGRVYNQEIPALDTTDEVVILKGFWQATKFLNFYSREQVRQWFALREEIRLKQDGEKYVAFHIRRGDMAENKAEWATIDRDAYGIAIAKRGFDNLPIVEVSELSPHTAPSILEPSLQFIIDFQILMDATVIFRANSSFSWWAATLGSPMAVFSPQVKGKYGEVIAHFEQGNHCAFTSGVDSPDVELLNDVDWASEFTFEREGVWWLVDMEQAEHGPFPTEQAARLEVYKLAVANSDIG